MSSEKVKIVVNMCDCECNGAKRTCNGRSSAVRSSSKKTTTRGKGAGRRTTTTPSVPPTPQYQEPSAQKVRVKKAVTKKKAVRNSDYPVFMIPEKSDMKPRKTTTSKASSDLPVFMIPEKSDRKAVATTTTKTRTTKQRTTTTPAGTEKWARQQLKAPKTTTSASTATKTKQLPAPKTTTTKTAKNKTKAVSAPAKTTTEQLPAPEPIYITAPAPSYRGESLSRRDTTRNVNVSRSYSKTVVVDNTYKDQLKLMKAQEKQEKKAKKEAEKEAKSLAKKQRAKYNGGWSIDTSGETAPKPKQRVSDTDSLQIPQVSKRSEAEQRAHNAQLDKANAEFLRKHPEIGVKPVAQIPQKTGGSKFDYSKVQDAEYRIDTSDDYKNAKPVKKKISLFGRKSKNRT